MHSPISAFAFGSGAALLAALALGLGCRADTTGLETLSVAEVAARLAAEPAPIPVDANSDETRLKHGLLPGALLLSSYRDYDAAAELPADPEQGLVFYCHSPMCGAAAAAARRALAAGHRRVWVMPEGIRGWGEAGQPVARPGEIRS